MRVHRIPPMKDARSTRIKPSRLNWVDSKVNIKRPQEINRTTRIRNGFGSSSLKTREKNRINSTAEDLVMVYRLMVMKRKLQLESPISSAVAMAAGKKDRT